MRRRPLLVAFLLAAGGASAQVPPAPGAAPPFVSAIPFMLPEAGAPPAAPARPAATSPAAPPATPPATPPAQAFLPTPTAGRQPADDAALPEPGEASAAAYGAFQRGYYLSALRLAEPLANLGDPAAQTLIGEIYGRGLGVPRNEAEAARWYAVAARAGVAEAQFRYALMLAEGRAVPADPATARDLMKAAADAGNPLAAYNFGQMLIRSSPTGGFAEALGYFRTAAERGVPDAQYALSQLYAYGRGPEQADDVAARRWLAEAARGGHDTAQIELGIWLVNGRGGPADAAEGFRWLKGAAEGGNPIAMNRLAHLFKDGIGTAADRGEAAKWAVLARRAGNSDNGLDTFFRSLGPEEQRAALAEANRSPHG